MKGAQRDSIFTHNHPSSSAFSGPDVNMNMYLGINKEARVVGYKYEYSMVIKDYSQLPVSRRYFYDAWKREHSILQPKYQTMYSKKLANLVYTGTPADKARVLASQMVSQLHTHETMQYLAKIYKFEYKRWLR